MLSARLYPGYLKAFQLPLPQTVEEGVLGLVRFLAHDQGDRCYAHARPEVTVTAELVVNTTVAVLVKQRGHQAFHVNMSPGKQL